MGQLVAIELACSSCPYCAPDEVCALHVDLELEDVDACARCAGELDEAGFCSTCGAVTIAGELHAATVR